MNQLRRDIIGLYLDDYTRRWDALLADIALKPFANLSQGGRTSSICCRRPIRRCATC